MKASAKLKFLLLLTATALVSACGGSSSDSDGGFTPPAITVSATSQSTTVTSGNTTDISVRVNQSGGAPVANGTSVTASVVPAANGTIVSVDGSGALGGATASTNGGVANFRFRATGPGGPAAVTFSVVDPNAPGRTVSTTVNITVAPPGPDNRLLLQATTTTLPINAFNVLPFIGSPFMAEVTVTVRTSSGQSVNLPNGIQVSVNPVGSTGGFSTLDDPTTPTINEFTNRLGQGPVNVVAGKATLFMHSLNLSGTTTMTVTFTDPETSQVVTSTLNFTIVSSISSLPAAVVVSPLPSPVYVQGSGGNTSSQIEILVRDGIGQPVPNPVSGNNAFNNVRVELLGDAASGGARVSGVNAQGQNVQGAQISLRTIAGVSGALLTSGTQTGSALIRVTADRADNNVDNGISDPVVAERTVFVSDGVLFDVEITQPFVNAILVNPVDPSVTQTGTPTVPASPDGTYSITVGVIATDRLGNPVLPGTVISFGLIDEPQATGAGDFLIAGNDGNPQENGTLFTAPTGRFTTAGGGVGPGDAVVILSEEDPANRDLEGARVVQTVNGPGSLTVQRRFNRNDVTGSIFDAGNALTYVIGRAADGNISTSASTNVLGVARTTMNYPVSRVGKYVVIWAQGTGAIVSGQARLVADAEYTRFAGVAPGQLFVSPNRIPANTTTPVSICVTDALNVPIEAVDVSFAFEGLNGAQGRVDGSAGPGRVAQLTGRDGCAVASVTTTGVTEGGAKVNFGAVGQTAAVDIEVGTLVLTATPSSLLGGGAVVTLRLVDASGTPVSGVQLTGSCTSEGGAIVTTEPASPSTGVTNANGEAPFSIATTNLNQANTPGSGVCTYQVPSGTPSTTVNVRGIDTCAAPTSPPDPDCGNSQTLTINFANSVNPIPGGQVITGQVISVPSGISCTYNGVSGGPVCSGTFAQGTFVQIGAVGATNSAAPTISGGCVASGPPVNGTPTTQSSAEGQTTMNGARACTFTFSPGSP